MHSPALMKSLQANGVHWGEQRDVAPISIALELIHLLI